MAVRLDTLTANQVAEVERGLQTLLNLFDAPREKASLEETERV
jgi:hypothetical protein